MKPPIAFRSKASACGLLLALVSVSQAQLAAEVSGRWDVSGRFDAASLARGWPEVGAEFTCALEVVRSQIAGECTPADGSKRLAVTGETHGENITWRFEMVIEPGAPPVAMTYTGRLDQAQKTLRGTFSLSDFGGDFTATRR